MNALSAPTNHRTIPTTSTKWYVARRRSAQGKYSPRRQSSANSWQVRYAATAIDNAKSARARGSYLRVSFKNTRETAQAINGWKLERALTYLGNVLEHKEAVPMRRYAGGTGRTAQGESPWAMHADWAWRDVGSKRRDVWSGIGMAAWTCRKCDSGP